MEGAMRAPLHDGVVEKLREMIISCELKPGERLPENDIVQAFGVSRTPLREALKLLAAEGLVEIRPHRGAVIAEISLEEISQTFDIMESFEGMAGPIVCDRISNKDLAELEVVVEEMNSRYRARDLKSYFHLNKIFHNRVISLSGNKVLSSIYTEMYDKVQRARYLVNDNEQRWQESSEEHKWIMEALRARDGAVVGYRLKAHTARTKKAIIEQLNSSPYRSAIVK
jgi:DNA-binding GntR family transcriptional regulator